MLKIIENSELKFYKIKKRYFKISLKMVSQTVKAPLFIGTFEL